MRQQALAHVLDEEGQVQRQLLPGGRGLQQVLELRGDEAFEEEVRLVLIQVLRRRKEGRTM